MSTKRKTKWHGLIQVCDDLKAMKPTDPNPAQREERVDVARPEFTDDDFRALTVFPGSRRHPGGEC